MTKKHFSASQVMLFGNCGEAYRRRYIMREYMPMGVSQIGGISFHNMAKRNFRYKKIYGNDLSEKVLKEVVEQNIDSMFEKDIRFNEEEQIRGHEVVKKELKEIISNNIPNFLELYRDVVPVEVEQPSVLDHPDWDRSIKYVMDLETAEGVIYDHKTGKKLKSKNDVDVDMGLTVYSLAYLAKHQKQANKIIVSSFASYITPKRKDLVSKCTQIETTRNAKDYEIFFRRVSNIQKCIKAEIFNPAPIGNWACQPKFCEYWKNCPYMNNERLLASLETIQGDL